MNVSLPNRKRYIVFDSVVNSTETNCLSGLGLPFDLTVPAADHGIPTIHAVCRRFHLTRLHVDPCSLCSLFKARRIEGSRWKLMGVAGSIKPTTMAPFCETCALFFQKLISLVHLDFHAVGWSILDLAKTTFIPLL
jgi:hypothetical protein